MRDARDERAENQRRDEHLDQVEEDGGERAEAAQPIFIGLAVGGHEASHRESDDDAQNHADQDENRKATRHPILPCPADAGVASGAVTRVY
jgi:hypothetical protein